MNTIKITLTIQHFQSWMADLLMAEMADQGFDTFQETGNGFEAYIPEKEYEATLFSKWISQKSEEYQMEWQQETIPAQNWNEVWEKNYFQPLVIKDQVLVRAPFHTDYPHCPIEIVIEPNMAFGTGNHETTSLMMEAMLELDFEGKTVLDMGCGTGILAILASRLGAKEVTAIDNDPWSVEAVTENRIINRTPNVTPILGDGNSLGDGASGSVISSGEGASGSIATYGIILVNIQRNVILADMEKYVQVLKPGGKILFSGFYEEDLQAIIEKAADYAICLSSFMTRNNWVVAVMLLK
jgi:ribosomal protein L11 methyltransferase